MPNKKYTVLKIKEISDAFLRHSVYFLGCRIEQNGGSKLIEDKEGMGKIENLVILLCSDRKNLLRARDSVETTKTKPEFYREYAFYPVSKKELSEFYRRMKNRSF